MVISGYMMVLALIAQVSDARYAYELVEPFFYPGGCDSAARIGEHIALACKAGIWLGPPNDLQLTLACLASDEQPNRVRALDETGFVAVTPCGLYRINLSGDDTRLPLPAESTGAFDTDGNGQLVLAADGWLWQWSVQHPVWRRFGPEASAEPQRIELADGYVLRAGLSTDVIGLADGQRERSFEDDAQHALLAGERALSVDERGSVWLSALVSREGTVQHLDLAPHENIQSVLGWGAAALILTTTQLHIVGNQTPVSIPIPGNGSGWIPVHPRSGLPWLIGPGGLYRPTRAVVRTRSELRDVGSGWPTGYLPRSSHEQAAPFWTRFLPRIELRAGGTHRHTFSNHSDNGRVDRREDPSFAGWLMLVWDLPSSRYQSFLNEHEILMRELRVAESERIAYVTTAITNWNNTGDPTESRGLAEEELNAQVEMLAEH